MLLLLALELLQLISNPASILCCKYCYFYWHWNVCNWFQIHTLLASALFLQSYNIQRSILCRTNIENSKERYCYATIFLNTSKTQLVSSYWVFPEETDRIRREGVMCQIWSVSGKSHEPPISRISKKIKRWLGIFHWFRQLEWSCSNFENTNGKNVTLGDLPDKIRAFPKKSSWQLKSAR